MSAAELLEQAQAEGVLLVLVDGRLTWEADHEPPCELLEEIRSHRLEVIEALSVASGLPKCAWDWLGNLAVLLGCSPDYLMDRGFVDRHDLAEQRHIHPRFAARLICSHPDWRVNPDRSARAREKTATETIEFREQYAHAREEGGLCSVNSPAWITASEAFNRHALGGCPHCFPPLGRYCVTGAELRARLDLVTPD